MESARATKLERDLTVAEIAEATGLSSTLIRQEINRGTLAAYRVGARYRVELDAVLDWKARCRVKPRYEPPIYELPTARSRPSKPTSRLGEQLAAVEAQGRAGA